MVTNELLETKYRAQQHLSEQAGHDLRAYARNIRKVVQATEKKHGLEFRYEPIRHKATNGANAAPESTDKQTSTAPKATVAA